MIDLQILSNNQSATPNKRRHPFEKWRTTEKALLLRWEKFIQLVVFLRPLFIGIYLIKTPRRLQYFHFCFHFRTYARKTWKMASNDWKEVSSCQFLVCLQPITISCFVEHQWEEQERKGKVRNGYDPASLHILITAFSPRLGFDTWGFVKLEATKLKWNVKCTLQLWRHSVQPQLKLFLLAVESFSSFV